MKRKCPKCGSSHIDTKDTARKTCATAGGVASASIASKAATTSKELVKFIAPQFAAASKVLDVLAAIPVGVYAGAKAGEEIDRTILKNNICMDCKHEFSD
jgi:hypothetical protein